MEAIFQHGNEPENEVTAPVVFSVDVLASPDSNPIQNIWTQIKAKLTGKTSGASCGMQGDKWNRFMQRSVRLSNSKMVFCRKTREDLPYTLKWCIQYCISLSFIEPANKNKYQKKSGCHCTINLWSAIQSSDQSSGYGCICHWDRFSIHQMCHEQKYIWNWYPVPCRHLFCRMVPMNHN